MVRKKGTPSRALERGIKVLSIGHSTRTIEDFIALLKAHQVTLLVDVRTMPGSRHNPQFNKETLEASLKEAGIGYLHMAGLGGLRHTTKDSLNVGWRNASFRGYADYMQTPEFETNLLRLIELARHHQVAIMCAEAVPWRCHRSLIGDALLVHGIQVKEIESKTHLRDHTLTPFANVKGTVITYPAADSD